MTDPTQSVADAAFEAWIDAQENPRALLQSEVWLAAFASGAQAEREQCQAYLHHLRTCRMAHLHIHEATGEDRKEPLQTYCACECTSCTCGLDALRARQR